MPVMQEGAIRSARKIAMPLGPKAEKQFGILPIGLPTYPATFAPKAR
jgi:hypothetical protein